MIWNMLWRSCLLLISLSIPSITKVYAGCSGIVSDFLGNDLYGNPGLVPGTTAVTYDESCCLNCNINPYCEFWIRELSDIWQVGGVQVAGARCWIKTSFQGYQVNNQRRGGFRQLVPLPNDVCAEVNENFTATLIAPVGRLLGTVSFAAYGNSVGTCNNYSLIDNNFLPNTTTKVYQTCTGQTSCNIPAKNTFFGGDPWKSNVKNLKIQMTTYPNTSVCGYSTSYSASLSISVTLPGYKFDSIIFAAYGVGIKGACGNWSIGSYCTYSTSYVTNLVTNLCINKTSCSFNDWSDLFPNDACSHRRHLVLELKQVDIDECQLGMCDPLTICTNTPGSFSCSPCPAGYSGTGATGCIRRCTTQPNIPNTQGTCTVPVNAGSTCSKLTCLPTYTLVNSLLLTCTSQGSWATNGICQASSTTPTGTPMPDVNACQITPCLAGINATCADLPNPALSDASGRTCTCVTGFSGNGDICVDMNACELSPCLAGANATCTDLPPPSLGDTSGRKCICGLGFSGNGDSCIDINACQNYGCAATATCHDLPPPAIGSADGRTCTCNIGYIGNGETCEDVNACQTSPCLAGSFKSVCVDRPPPAPATSAGRNCSCLFGFSGNGDVCTDIDECLTTESCPSPQCLNSQGSYSCAPQIVPGSLRIISGAEDPLVNNDTGLVVANISGGAILQFNMTGGFNFTYSNITVSGNPNIIPGCPLPEQAVPFQYFNCSTFEVLSNNTIIQCTIPKGFGSCLIFTVQVCTIRTSMDPNEIITCMNLNGTDYWSYPHPTLIPGTLRLYGRGAQFASNILELDAGNPSVHPIQFDGTNIVTDPRGMIVTYGPLTNPDAYNCTLNAIYSTSTLVVCTPQQAGDLHNILRIELPSADYEVITTDELQFPRYPNIVSISGCTKLGCPTKGILLTLTGYNFDNQSTVLIGGIECTTTSIEIGEYNSSSNSTDGIIICQLQPGVGRNLPVVITSLGRQSISVHTVSFQPPSVTNITSLLCTSVMDGLKDCPREGGAEITLIGENFGESHALVLISGYECANLTYQIRHEVITCILPMGVNQLQPLSIVQGMQQDSSHIFISYAECLPGTYQMFQNPALGTTCGDCSAGLYSGTYGAASCLPCPAGTYSASKATSCLPCDHGSWTNVTNASIGAESCSPCPAGTSRQGNSLGCFHCSIGFFASDMGSEGCDVCAAGKYSTKAGASYCDLCNPGTARLRGSLEPCSSCQVGTFANISGLAACMECPPGMEATVSGATNCSLCQAGFARLSGPLFCEACPAGLVAKSNGLSTCSPCIAGTFSNTSGSSICDSCPLGYYSESGSVSCTSCPSGTYTNISGSPTCPQCEEGTWSNGSAITCDPCPVGSWRYKQLEGCEVCAQGKYQDSLGQTECFFCKIGFYQNQIGSSECVKCVKGRFSDLNGTIECFSCEKKGGYSNQDGSDDCTPCSEGLECPDGIAKPMVGFWSYETPSGDVEAVKCASGCGDSNNCGLNRLPYNQNPLCGKCLPGYSEWGGTCVLCSTPNAGIILALIVLSWIYVLIIHVLSQESGSPSTKVFLYFVATSHYLVTNKYYWLAWIWFFDFNLNDASSTICIAPLNAYQKLALQICTPLMYFAELWITALLHWYYIRCFRSTERQPLNQFINRYIRTSLAILLFSYSMITSLCFRYLTCTDAGSSQVVFTMPSIDCNEKLYFQWKIVIILLLIFPVIGLPLIFAALLWKYRTIIQLYDPKIQKIPEEEQMGIVGEVVVARYGILFATYRPHRYYWEIWGLLRRALLLAFGNFLLPYALIRVQVLTVLNVIILLLQLIYRPFQDSKYGNWGEAYSLSSLVFLSIFTSDLEINIPLYEQIVVTMITMIGVTILFLIALRRFLLRLHQKVIQQFEATSKSQATQIDNTGEGDELIELSPFPTPTKRPGETISTLNTQSNENLLDGVSSLPVPSSPSSFRQDDREHNFRGTSMSQLSLASQQSDPEVFPFPTSPSNVPHSANTPTSIDAA